MNDNCKVLATEDNGQPTVEEQPAHLENAENFGTEATTTATDEQPYVLDPVEEKYGKYFLGDGKSMVPNHRAIAAKFSSDCHTVFVPETDEFLRYNDTFGVWENIATSRLKHQLADFFRDLALTHDKADLAYKIKTGFLSSMATMLKGWESPYDPMTRSPKLFPAANGVLDFATLPPTLKDYAPGHFFRNGSKFKYEATATCPRFLQFLKDALPDDDISLIQRYFGSMFLGANSDHKILILKGTPGGGKSTLTTILERIIGMENVAYLRTQHLGGRFEFSGFLGKKLLTAKDVPGDTLSLKGAQLLKSLVGGDRLQAEIKYAGKAEVWGNFHLVIACNNSLKIALDKDIDAWRRRLLIVNYNREKTATPIQDLAEKLIEAEGHGIFTWMVQGAIEHAAEVEKSHGYVLTDQQKASVESLLGESQSCRVFIETRVEPHQHADVTTEELVNAYLHFCQSMGWTPETIPVAEKKFPELVMEIYQENKRNDIVRKAKQVRGYCDLRLKK